jgi:hypothetical protein
LFKTNSTARRRRGEPKKRTIFLKEPSVTEVGIVILLVTGTVTPPTSVIVIVIVLINVAAITAAIIAWTLPDRWGLLGAAFG